MRVGKRNLFTTLRTEGGLLPPDLLQKISLSDKSLDGLSLESYHLNPNERINEAASRSWNRLVNAWQSFRKAAQELPETERGTTITRERWLLILFQELGYGRLNPAKAIESNGKVYPISHFWKNTPIHLVGFRIDIDKRTAGIAGAARTSPHSLVQEFLNSSDTYLWGFVSNGYRLRILRDNVSLTRQAYIEFDLEAMMEGQVYSDFVMLWLLCHQSRVEADKAEDCWLERWVQTAQEQGTRALDTLRNGVENAIKVLGSGFIAYPSNGQLREKLRSGAISVQDYYRQLLRLVYRLIFLFVAEDRNLLFSPNAENNEKKEFYTNYYSASRLRRMAERMRGTKHCDLYHGLRVIMQKLGENDGCELLGLSVLGSFLWSKEAIPDLTQNEISNIDILSAMRSLSFIIEGKILRVIDYRNLGSEELGSVYESLLELHPVMNIEAGSFDFQTVSGHERKTTGSYYTPSSLIHCLLDSALDPVINEARKKENPEKSLLSLKICDPACGSGHFLIAAAHRLAKRLAAVRTGDDEPSPEAIRKAIRDVIGHCIYGVDINPMAVELCKVGLWMEALEPGKPLSFLDHRIVCGNSLLGTTPKLLKDGILDNAFEPIEGDDKKYCQEFKKRNKIERQGQRSLFDAALKPWEKLGNLATAMVNLEEIEDDTIEGIKKKQRKYEEFVKSSGYLFGRFFADTWCAAFVWKKTESKELPYPITEETFRNIEKNPHTAPHWMKEEVQRLANQYQFFHWHIMFPDVFRVPQNSDGPENKQTGWSGGFDVVMGNPPWEHTELKDKEWFSTKVPAIGNARTDSDRKKLIKHLEKEEPFIFIEFMKDKRFHASLGYFIGKSSLFPLCGQGRINTYAIFAELSRNIVCSKGRAGIIVPSGIATDDTYKEFFNKLMLEQRLISLFDFENRDRVLFPDVYYRMRFCLLTFGGRDIKNTSPEFAFFALKVSDLSRNEMRFKLALEDIALINPNTKTCPIIRSSKEVDILTKIYSEIPILNNESRNINPWNVILRQGFFNMSSDSGLFSTEAKLYEEGFQLKGNIFVNNENKYIPLYEGRMINIFDHRYASTIQKDIKMQRTGDSIILTSFEKENDTCHAMPRYWVNFDEVINVVEELKTKHWFLGYMSITSATNARTCIASMLPLSAIGHSISAALSSTSADFQSCLLANLSSFVFDFICKRKTSGNNFSIFIVKQLPVLSPERYLERCKWDVNSLKYFISRRALELIYTSLDLKHYARDFGYDGPPFKWNDERRFLLRNELDAAYFHIYGITRVDVEYIMETFLIVRKKDEETYGEYQTKRVILEIYDEMAEAMRTGKPYQTRLDPPPADPSVAHPSKTEQEIIK